MRSTTIACFIGLVIFCISWNFTDTSAFFQTSKAEDAPTLENLYINPEGKTKPEAIIFYNTANITPRINQAISLISTILTANYTTEIQAYLINIEQHPEFISAFNLSEPLTLVLIRISDGAAFGYENITDLTDGIDDIPSYTQMLTEKIDNFLSIQAEN